jgi:predicted RNA-binding Zn-ribbon protein involved in translation (DUF1610 family)
MAGQGNRRRPRVCPSCGGDTIVRGEQVEGVSVSVSPTSEAGPGASMPAYSDVCHDCGMVMLYVRVGEAGEDEA